MFKKFVLYPIYFVLIGSILFVGIFYFTPLPYLPLNLLLSSSPDISGHITGSVLTGVRIKDLSIKGTPDGEITAKEIAFRYNGLDYLFRDRLVITEITLKGVKADLPQGNLANWSDIQRRLDGRSFLIPPVYKKSVALIQIDNVIARDIDIRVGKNPIASSALGPLAYPFFTMSPRLLGQGTIPGLPPGGMPQDKTVQPKTENKFTSFRLVNLEITNSRFESFMSKRPSILSKMIIDNLSIEKEKFDLGRYEIQSDSLDLTVAKSPESGSGWESLVVDIRGTVKRGSNEKIKKDIGFSGRYQDKLLNLSAFDGRVTLKAGMSPASPMPSLELNVSGLNLPDYFLNIAPLTNITFSYQPSILPSGQNQSPVSFSLGVGRFEGTIMGWSPGRKSNGPPELIFAQHTKARTISATVVFDAALPGKLGVKLWDPQSLLPPKYLLSRVWYGKNYELLKPKEIEFLKTNSAYFGIPAEEFKVILKKPAKTRKTRRRR